MGSINFSPYTTGYPLVGTTSTLSAPALRKWLATTSAHLFVSSAYAGSAEMLGMRNNSKSSSSIRSRCSFMYSFTSMLRRYNLGLPGPIFEARYVHL